MEIILVRHALPRRIVNVDTPANPPLDDRGHAQAAHVAAYLSSEAIDAVWSSPMTRAQETAAPIAAALGLALRTDPGLAEYDKESPEYIPVEEMKATNHPMWQAMARGEWVGPDDAAMFRTMVVEAIEGLVASHPQQRVAMVCHGGVINAYLMHVLNLPPKQGFFYPEYTSIHRVMAASTGQRSIRSVNEIAHLRGTGLLD